MGLSDLLFTHYIAYALQCCLGIVFLVAAVQKLRRPLSSVRTVAEYRLLPDRLAPLLAVGLIAVESFLAVAFLFNWMRSIAQVLALCVLVIFMAGVTINLRRGRRIPCGCFSAGGEPISARSVVRLVFLIVAVVLVAILPTPPVSLATLWNGGSMALADLVQVGETAFLLFITAAWLLNAREASFALRHLRRTEVGDHPSQGSFGSYSK